jgi:hypothetical protein
MSLPTIPTPPVISIPAHSSTPVSSASSCSNQQRKMWSAREECESSLTMRIRCGRKMLLLLIPLLIVTTITFNISMVLHHLRHAPSLLNSAARDEESDEGSDDTDDSTNDDAYVTSIALNATLGSKGVVRTNTAVQNLVQKRLQRLAAVSSKQSKLLRSHRTARRGSHQIIQPNPSSLSSEATFSAWYVMDSLAHRCVCSFAL